MSLWLHKNLHKRHLLWLKLLSVCFFFHCTVLLWVFFIHNNDSYDISLTLNKHIDYSSPILFVPIATPTTTQKSLPLPHNNKIITQKAAVKKETIIAERKEPVKIDNPSTIATLKKEEKLASKTPEPIKKENSTPKKEIAQKAAASTQQASTIKQQALPIPENAHISDNYKEVESLRRHALLQKELINNWHPPIGISSNTTCEISFTVNTQGSPQKITITKSSGITMYDISARNALFAMKMPQWTYGKTITINFTQ